MEPAAFFDYGATTCDALSKCVARYVFGIFPLQSTQKLVSIRHCRGPAARELLLKSTDSDFLTGLSHMITRHFNPEDIPIDFERAYKFLKIRKRSENFLLMHDHLAWQYEKHLPDFRPRYRYSIREVLGHDRAAEMVDLQGGVQLRGAGIHRLLQSARYAAIFVLTLGDKIDAELAMLNQGDFTDAYFLDGVASALADGLLQVLKQELQTEAKQRSCILGGRFSPGYARWELREQEKIFAILNANEIGVSLSETFFMIPQKSLSGVFAFKPEDNPA